MPERLVLLNTNYSNHNYKEGYVPSNEQRILDFIQEQKMPDDDPGNTTFVFIDTIWKDRFDHSDPETGENRALAAHLGTRAAFHVGIEDDQYANNPWKKHIGITIATDHEVAAVEAARLGHPDTARNALIADLKIGAEIMKLAAMYMPETDPHAQWSQLIDMDRKLNGENPIRKPSGYQAVAMDANGLSKHEAYTQPLPRFGSAFVHSLAKTVKALKNPSDRSYYQKTFVTLDERRAVPHMRTLGYRDIEAGPTYPDAVPLLDPDKIFTYGLVKRSAHTVKGLSDHRAVVYDFDLR